MFNKNEYINNYNKTNYKSIKLRIKKDDMVVLSKIINNENINKYIRDLIFKDYENRIYHYINKNVLINFKLSNTMKQLVNEAEKADFVNDYGLYMNLVEAIDSQAKKETTHHIMRESEWKQLINRYSI